jgi:geranylgeranyl pyrophosphate synthase
MQSIHSSDIPIDIKQVPQDPRVRTLILNEAITLVSSVSLSAPPSRADLEVNAIRLLTSLNLPESYLGFCMVALNNAFWKDRFSSIPFHRRLLLLPHCLRDQSVCAGVYDSIGLHCAGCGACDISSLKSQAEALGYTVIVAEGTSVVLMRVLDDEVDGILGVACLDSLEKSFQRTSEMGIPMMAIPLLRDGCVDTEAEIGLIQQYLMAQVQSPSPTFQSYLPLMRLARSIFLEPALHDYLGPALPQDDKASFRNSTDRIAYKWLMKGGKRFRPFVTLAAYAVSKYGVEILSSKQNLDDMIPKSIKRYAVAIECLHKASLIHDDIEDNDPYRYGEKTLFQTYGYASALNVGDFLIGAGYRLIASPDADIPPDAVADILAHMSAAHLDLCRGQGMEFLDYSAKNQIIRPIDALSIYMLKTSPAFEAALYTGIRSAGKSVDMNVLRRFCNWLGQGYQILNDLEDWEDEEDNKVISGHDLLALRPTILRAFAMESGARLPEIPENIDSLSSKETAEYIRKVKMVFDSSGAHDRAERLLDKLRERCLALAREIEDPGLSGLFHFLAANILAG